MKQLKLMLGDNMESLKKLPDNSIDSVVTDCPYGLGKEPDPNVILKDWAEKGYSEVSGKGFMGKYWDAFVPQPAFWKEVFRVLKPGGHVLAFFGTRTYDWGVMAIRLGGFEIRDCISWLYGSGFPKSHNIGLSIDKYNGIIGNRATAFVTAGQSGQRDLNNPDRTIRNYEANNENNGWGTALKPAQELICVARKPLSEKTVAENVLKWGTGGINIDGCRIGLTNELDKKQANKETKKSNTENDSMFGIGRATGDFKELNTEGRFPANIIFECTCDEVIKGEKGEITETKLRGKRFDPTQNNRNKVYESKNGFTTNNYNDTGDTHTNPECPCYILDKQSGKCKTGNSRGNGKGSVFGGGIMTDKNMYNDTKDGASRFFYVAKVSKMERNLGLEDFEEKVIEGTFNSKDESGNKIRLDGSIKKDSLQKNHHPTVKPINLLTYLVRLVTPKNGIVLDPFMGSGSTGIAAQLEGFSFIGMEMEEEYFNIATARIEAYEKYRNLLK